MGDERETVRGGMPRARDRDATVDLRPSAPTATRETPPPERDASAFDPPPDRFRTVGELGRGGMGRVDDAYDRALDRPVAIKHMLSDATVDHSRFEREARITARLEHPGIVPVHDAGRGPDGTPYYVMRRVDGRPLAELVAGKKLRERLALIPNLLAACDAAAYAHARAIVHRDIKPTNILVGPFGETLVIDWGLAREIGEREAAPGGVPASEPQLTRAGTIAGTPGFMAPEQARGEPVDARADVFALGATLFFVLSGQQPYGTASETEMVDLAGAGRAPAWQLIPREVPRDLRAIAMKAMAGSADARYADAGALAADLRRFVTGNLVGAYAYGALARVRRFVRRHRGAVAVAAVSAVALAVGATISVRRIVTERDDADAARRLAEARQHQAADVADEMLLAHASELLAIDPTAAIQQLRRLDPSSSHWPEAATIAQGAALRGIAFGFAGGPNETISIAPDSRTLVIAPFRTGPASVIDLVTRTRRTIPAVEVRGHIAWPDAGHATFLIVGGMMELDLATLRTRRRTLPDDVDQLACGGGHCRFTERGSLYELASFDAAPVRVASDVMSFEGDSYLQRTPGGLDLVDAAGRFPLGRTSDNAFFKPGGVFLYDLPKLDVFRVDAGAPHEVVAVDVHGMAMGMAIDGNRVLVSTSDGVYRVSATGMHRITTDVTGWMAAAPQRHRIVVARRDGGLLVFDHDTMWETGAHVGLATDLDMSRDGRFVAVRTASGDVLVWDLDRFGPQVLPAISPTENLIGVTPRAMWTYGAMSLFRYDRATGRRQALREDLAPLVNGAMVADGSLLVLESLRSNTDVSDAVFDGATGRTVEGSLTRPPLALSVQHDRVLVIEPDGSIDELTNRGGLRRRRLASVAPGASRFDVNAHVAVVAYPSGTIERLELATQRREHVQAPGPLQDLFVDAHDVTWLRTQAGVWRWDGAGPLHPIALPRPIADFVPCRDDVVGRAAGALFVLDRQPIRAIAMRSDVSPEAMMRAVGCIDSSWLATQDVAHGLIVMADLATGVTFSVPTPPTLHVQLYVTSSELVQATDDGANREVVAWPLRVPRDPAALRAWLAHVTNAVPVHDSDAVVWP